MRTLKHFIELELAKIEPQWTAEGKGSYWWGVKIGLETVLAKLCEMDGTVMVNAPQPERRQYDPHGSLSEYGIFPECDAAPAAQTPRACTCHPDDRPDGPCRERYAASECQALASADGAMVERIAALLYEEATGDPWTVAGVEHPGPDRDYYRGLARKVAALATQNQEPTT